MIPILENAILGTDLDGNFQDLLNVAALDPVPLNIATSDDIRLSDARPPLPGSVTDESVADDAAIVQSKLNFNGQIPTAWLGTAPGTAAPGDLAEYVANKNQPGGYAGLDGSGKVPSAVLPGDTGTGTVTSVGLSMPPASFTVAGSPITGAGTFAVAWLAAPDASWFGNKSGAPGAPQFYTTPFPPSLIPSLDASIVTSGVFAAALLPVAIGVGVLHAPGAVPDPGDGTIGSPGDYLARDISWKSLPTIGPAYQPTLPDTTFVTSGGVAGPIFVTPQSIVPGVTFFCSTTSGTSGFTELTAGSVSVPLGTTVWVYSARQGFNNSTVVSIAV